MAAVQHDAWLFVAEWFDPVAQIKKAFLLKYFIGQHQAELVDLKTKKLFLKKSVCPPELSPSDFFVGGKVLLYSRELNIVDYGDGKTRSLLQKQTQKSFILLPSNSYNFWGEIVDNIIENNYNLVGLQTVNVSGNASADFVEYLGEREDPNIISQGTCLLVAVHSFDAISTLYTFADQLSNRYKVRLFAPQEEKQSIAAFSSLRNSLLNPTVTLNKCTCCIVKPHAMKNKLLGKVIGEIIKSGYDISAISSISFDHGTAEEFLEVYKGVVPYFADLVAQQAAGMCVALEVRRSDDVVNVFREEVVGPWDVEIAKEIRPNTVRGKWGVNRVLSVVHCTDLDTDGANECEYCFCIMDQLLSESFLANYQKSQTPY